MSKLLQILYLFWFGDWKHSWHPIGLLTFGTTERDAANILFKDPNSIHKQIAHGNAIVGCMAGALAQWILEQPEIGSTERFTIDAQGAKFFKMVRWSNKMEYLVQMWRYPRLDRRRGKVTVRLVFGDQLVCRASFRVTRLERPKRG